MKMSIIAFDPGKFIAAPFHFFRVFPLFGQASKAHHLVAGVNEFVKILLGCHVAVLCFSQSPGAHAGPSGIEDAVAQCKGLKKLLELIFGRIHLIVCHRAAVEEQENIIHLFEAKVGKTKGIPEDFRVLGGTDDSHFHLLGLL
jgi:hypothetical protein